MVGVTTLPSESLCLRICCYVVVVGLLWSAAASLAKDNPVSDIVSALNDSGPLYGDETHLLVARDIVARYGPKAVPKLEELVRSESQKDDARPRVLVAAFAALAIMSENSSAFDSVARLYDFSSRTHYYFAPYLTLMPPRSLEKLLFLRLNICGSKDGLEPCLERAELATMLIRFGDERACQRLSELAPQIPDKQFALVVEHLLLRRALIVENVLVSESLIRQYEQDLWKTTINPNFQRPDLTLNSVVHQLLERRAIPLEFAIASTYMSRVRKRVPGEASRPFELQVACEIARRSLEHVELLVTDEKRPVELRHQAVEVIAMLKANVANEALLRVHRTADARTAGWIADAVLLHQNKNRALTPLLTALKDDARLSETTRAALAAHIQP